MKPNTASDIRTIIMSIVMFTYLVTSLREFQGADSCLSLNGAQWVSSKAEDGFITKSTNLNLIYYYLDVH